MKIFCLIIIWGSLLGSILMSSSFDQFINKSALLTILGGISMAIAFRHGWKSLFNLKLQASIWVKNGEKECELLKTIGYSALILGALHSLIGCVLFYKSFKGWLAEGQGTGPELTLIGIFYGLTLFLGTLILSYVGKEE